MKYDVIVVGAGPSGSIAAKTLAERDINVLIVDKEKFPRDKPCGGGIPFRTLSRFPYLNDLKSIQSYSYGGFIRLSSSPFKTEILRSEPVFAMVQRSQFDEDLVKLAIEKGAEFQDGKLVSDIKIKKDSAQIYYKNAASNKADLIIGADGFHSIVAKKMNLSLTKRKKGICVLEEFHLNNELIKKHYTSKYLCYIHSKIEGIKGYGWVFPKRNHVNVGIISYDGVKELKQKKGNIQHIFSNYLDLLRKDNIIPDHIESVNMKGGLVPVHPLSTTFSDRILLCGDAAGLINPISGEGIYYALVSGKFAGEVSTDSINRQDTTEQFLSVYEKKWKKDFGKDLNIFLRSKKQWGKQGDNIIKMMNKDPKFAEMIFLIMVGKKRVSDMRWKLIRRFLFNLLSIRKNKKKTKIY